MIYGIFMPIFRGKETYGTYGDGKTDAVPDRRL